MVNSSFGLVQKSFVETLFLCREIDLIYPIKYLFFFCFFLHFVTLKTLLFKMILDLNIFLL